VLVILDTQLNIHLMFKIANDLSGDLNTGIYFPSADTIAFTEGGAEAMRIDSSGRLLVGQTSTTDVAGVNSALQIVGTGVDSFASLIRYADSSVAGVAPGLLFTRSNGAKGTNTIVANGNSLGFLHFVGANGINFNIAATISGEIDGTPGASNDMPGRLVFFTTPDGTASPVERMRINSDGYTKISNDGTYISSAGIQHEMRNTANSNACSFSCTNATQTQNVLNVECSRNTDNGSYSFIACARSGIAYVFRVQDSGNVINTNNSYGGISDIKIKQDIIDASSQWNDIKNVRVRKFRYKNNPTGFLHIGVVAQELEQVSPNLIEESKDFETKEVPVLNDNGNPVLNEDGTPQVKEERIELDTTTKSVKYSILYMKAIKALQEAMERIETLEAKVTTLENK